MAPRCCPIQVEPGDALTSDAQVVCVRGYARRERNVSPEVKREVYRLYNVRPSTEVRNGKRVRLCCEVDHLISLELGGSNDIKNLWPQPHLRRPGGAPEGHVGGLASRTSVFREDVIS
jgi:hypothetical protein